LYLNIFVKLLFLIIDPHLLIWTISFYRFWILFNSFLAEYTMDIDHVEIQPRSWA